MSDERKNFKGMICPYIVMNVIRATGKLDEEESITFEVDDPMAPKAIQEELGHDGNIKLKILKHDKHWEIKVRKIDEKKED